MRQVLGPGALGRPRGIGWRGRWEGGPGWGIHVNPWLIHFNVWQKPLQCCKVISLQLIKINGKKKVVFQAPASQVIFLPLFWWDVEWRRHIYRRFDRWEKNLIWWVRIWIHWRPVTHKSGDTSVSLGSWSFLGSSYSFHCSLIFVSFRWRNKQ